MAMLLAMLLAMLPAMFRAAVVPVEALTAR
jgi:hypothetical protein